MNTVISEKVNYDDMMELGRDIIDLIEKYSEAQDRKEVGETAILSSTTYVLVGLGAKVLRNIPMSREDVKELIGELVDIAFEDLGETNP